MKLTTNQKWILVATILASGMAFLDGSIVNIALPALQRDLGVTFVDMQWVINAYALTSASLLLLGGALGDRFGQRKVFSLGIATFIVASLLAGFSHSINTLLFARTIQGIGAAIMIPGSLAIIYVSFPENVRGRVIGLWAGVSGGMAAFGSFLGGVLIEKFNWPSIFFINVVIGLIALIATIIAVRDHEHEKRSLDIAGTIAITLGLSGLAYGLMQAPAVGWGSRDVIAALVVGVVAIIAFVLIEMRVKSPMVPPAIFKNPNVLGANLVTFFLYGALAAVFFLLALNLQEVQGFSPTTTALGLLPFPIIIMLFAGRGGQLADSIGPRMPMVLGPLMVAGGMALLALPGVGVTIWNYMPGIILWALGMCVVIAPLTKSAMSVEQASLSGAASGTNNAVSRVAGLLFVAVMGVLMLGLFGQQLDKKMNTVIVGADRQTILDQKDKLAGIVIPDSFSVSEKITAQNQIKESFVYAYRYVIGLNVVLALISALIASMTIRNKS